MCLKEAKPVADFKLITSDATSECLLPKYIYLLWQNKLTVLDVFSLIKFNQWVPIRGSLNTIKTLCPLGESKHLNRFNSSGLKTRLNFIQNQLVTTFTSFDFRKTCHTSQYFTAQCSKFSTFNTNRIIYPVVTSSPVSH